MNLVLAVIGTIAICIYYGQLNTMKGQLGQIIKQYPEIKRQADAAIAATNQAAADSVQNAERIERQLRIAASQAKAIEGSLSQSKTALARTIEISRLDQRAWVGVVGVNTEGGVATHDDFSVKSAGLIIHNSGKTPALKIRIECCMFVTRPWREPIPDYDAETAAREEQHRAARKESRERLEGVIRQHPEMRESLIARDKEFWQDYESHLSHLFHQGGVLAPGVPNSIGIIPSVKWGTRNDRKEPMSVYVLGKIVYRDIFSDTTEHMTKFCLMRTTGAVFTICPENNWMN